MKIHIPQSGQTELKMLRGGARVGAGRKNKGFLYRKVSLALKGSDWSKVEQLQKEGEKRSLSDVMREIIEMGLNQMNIQNEMERILVEVRTEFSKVLLLKDIPQEKKDKHYADLMTKLETSFRIPMLNNEKFNQDNPDVMRIYRQISDARSL